MNMRTWHSVALCLITAPSIIVFAQASAPSSKIGEINHGLASDNPADVDAAIAEIRDVIQNGNIPSAMFSNWTSSLDQKRRYAELSEITLSLIPASPDVGTAENLLQLRVKALLAIGKADEALVAAKIYYNVCAIANSETAADLICRCLNSIHGKQTDAALIFRISQADGSSEKYTNSSSSDLQDGSASLKSINITVWPQLEAGLTKWSQKREKFGDRLKYGNLLLISDRPKEALVEFTSLFEATPSGRDRAIAAEAIGRALRARDGDLSQANTWLKKVKTGEVK